MFLYLHDSVFLRNRLPALRKTCGFMPMWWAHKRYASTEMKTPEIQQVASKFQIGDDDGRKLIKTIYNNEQHVIFGGMGIFTSEFASWLSRNTNFRTSLFSCNTRLRRCLFERLLSAAFYKFHATYLVDDMIKVSVCGNVHVHTGAFTNQSFSIEAGNPYAVKIWQGR